MSPKQVALILLYNAEGQMLLQHRTDGAPVFPGHWAIFGGSIEGDETPEEAVRRECAEEIAYELEQPLLFMIYHFTYDGREHVIYLYIEEHNGKPLTLGEGQGMGWFKHEGMQPLLMNRFDRMFTGTLATAMRMQSLRAVS